MLDRTMIVVGVDYESGGDIAFDAAAQIAATHPVSEVHVLHVERVATDTEAALDRLELYTRARIDALQARRPMLWFEQGGVHLRAGHAAQHIVELAVDLDADLVVVGSHGRTGVKRLLLGSVSARVVESARCPVYVVRPKDHLAVGDIGTIEVPRIEPPCPDCLETRRQSRGGASWCARHDRARYRPRAHRLAGRHAPDSEPWSQSTP